jgi:hypothetical protein
MALITLNGTEFECEDRVPVLEAARRFGIVVPSLCFDARLAAIGSCRLCLVDIVGQSRPQLACRTKGSQGLRITTHSPALEHYRPARAPPAMMIPAILTIPLRGPGAGGLCFTRLLKVVAAYPAMRATPYAFTRAAL